MTDRQVVLQWYSCTALLINFRKVIASYTLYCNGFCTAWAIKLTCKRLWGAIENTQVGDMRIFQCSCWLLIGVKTKADRIECMLVLMASSFTNVCIPQGRYLCSVTRLYVTTKVLATSPVLKVKVVSFLVDVYR